MSRRACWWTDLDQLSFPELLLFFKPFNRPNVIETGQRVVFTANSDPSGTKPSRFLEVFAADVVPQPVERHEVMSAPSA